MRVIVVLLCLLAGTQLMSQVEIEIKPELRFIKSTGTSGPDTLQLRVPKPTALDLTDPRPGTPLASPSEDEVQPFWSVMWIFGNGDFLDEKLRSTPDEVDGDTLVYNKPYAYQYNTSVQPMALMTAVYSRDRNHRLAVPSPVNPTPTPSSPTSHQTEAGLFDSLEYVSLVLPWPTVRAKDVIILGINYRKPGWANGDSGTIELLFNLGHLSVESGAFAGHTPMPTADGGASGTVKWRFDDFTANSTYRTFFVKMAVNDIPLGTNNDKLPIKVRVNWDEESISEQSENIEGDNSYRFKQPTSSVVAGGQVETETVLSLTASNDPNTIRFTPLCFVSSLDGTQEADVEVTFMNKGNAPVRSLVIVVDYSTDQWETTRRDTIYYPNTPLFSFINVRAKEDPGSFRDDFRAKSGQSILLSVEEAVLTNNDGAESRSENLADKDLMEMYGQWIGGHVKFKINALPRLRAGDFVWMRATIIMDSIELKDSMRVEVCRFCGPKARWHYGARIYGHAPGTDLLKSGYGARLTLMAPLQRIRERVTGPSLSNYMLPDWWLQWEAGISQLRLENAAGNTLDFGYIDVMPFQLRWIPSRSFGDYFGNKRMGLSAGYTMSYAYRARVEGNVFEFKTSGDRVDHTIGASIDFLNILGRSGLSFGAGYNYRWTRYNGSPQNYGHAFVYVHYNLPYRLRFN